MPKELYPYRMDGRLCFSRRRQGHIGPLIGILLFLVCNPVHAAGISVSFDSDGRTIRSIAKPSDTSAGKTSRRTGPEGIELLADAAYEYYPVSGRTYSEIIRSVSENGPYNKARTRRRPCRVDWSATLSFQYDYSYAIDEESGKLHAATEIADIALEDSSTVTLPSLIDDTALTPVEQSMWRTYLSGVVEQCHAIIALIRDPLIRKTARENLTDITYLIFDYSEGMDIEKNVESFLSGEALRIGRDSVREIRSRIADFEKTAVPGGTKKSGKNKKTSGE